MWALPRGLWLCPKNPARTVSPMQPDQRVTLSLETPLRSCTPKNPSAKASKTTYRKQ
nr:MAG TPA: hypothetical protein [Caudoviricetes sp.]